MPQSAPDLAGQTFGYWTVLSPDPSRNGYAYMLCRCRCGTERIIQSSMLRHGQTLSCRCRTKEVVYNLIGCTFGFWMVLSRASIPKRGVYWLCQCICGTKRILWSQGLRRGDSQSCGCKTGEMISQYHTTHGETQNGKDSPEYSTWTDMKQRCLNPQSISYARYGGRGITIASEWKNDFPQFLRDMGRRPPGTTLERIDNNGHYSPSNCRWATPAEQARNTRRNIWLTHEGRRQCLKDWSIEVGIAYTTLFNRIKRGWNIIDTLTKPIQHTGKHT